MNSGVQTDVSLSAHPFTGSEFGATPRLPLTGFMVFGLLTFWAYSAVRIALALRAHALERWAEFLPTLTAAGLPEQRIEALRKHAFDDSVALPFAAAAVFALDAILVLGWFFRWVVVGAESDYWPIVGAVGASSLLFYAATCMLLLWLARRMQAHELGEFALVAGGPEAVSGERLRPDAQGVERWERLNNEVALFLIVAVPIAASPTIGAHFFLTGAIVTFPLLLPSMCFAAAALFHFWGTRLLVGLYNGHLAQEAVLSHKRDGAQALQPRNTRHTAAGGMENPAPSSTLEPYAGTDAFIFISYKRNDFDRIRPIMERIASWGYRVWYDKGIPGSAEWDALIEERLKACSLLVFFMSRDSVESKYCRREVKYVDQQNKPILCVKLENAELGHGLDMLLTQYQMVDAATQNFSGEIERALKYLRLL